MGASLPAVAEHAEQLQRIEAKLDALLAHAGGCAIGADADLIEAAANAFAGRLFTTKELMLRAGWQDEPGRRLTECIGGQMERALGIRLGKLAGRPTLGGLSLRRATELRGCKVWQVLS